jgi:hypothetical protein
MGFGLARLQQTVFKKKKSDDRLAEGGNQENITDEQAQSVEREHENTEVVTHRDFA